MVGVVYPVVDWANDVVCGTATPVSGSAGDNTVTVKSGGDVDFDPSGKYLGQVVVELDGYSDGDYVREVAVTNGTDRRVVAKNVPLAYGGGDISFASPRPVPEGYWVEVVVHLSSAKGITVTVELVW